MVIKIYSLHCRVRRSSQELHTWCLNVHEARTNTYVRQPNHARLNCVKRPERIWNEIGTKSEPKLHGHSTDLIFRHIYTRNQRTIRDRGEYQSRSLLPLYENSGPLKMDREHATSVFQFPKSVTVTCNQPRDWKNKLEATGTTDNASPLPNAGSLLRKRAEM